jgi:hypothetical protein
MQQAWVACSGPDEVQDIQGVLSAQDQGHGQFITALEDDAALSACANKPELDRCLAREIQPRDARHKMIPHQVFSITTFSWGI